MRATPLLVVGALALTALTACGDSDEATTAETTTTLAESTPEITTAETEAEDGATGSEKPEVQIPDELPTELVVTVLTPGSGREAAEGDTVVVDYVGVRSEDGTEFDNSYDRGQPFLVNLGGGGVIEGWDQGLRGAQAGSRIQLDIPAELAYGDRGAGGAIRPGDALTFVIDVRAVVPPSNPKDAPEVELEPSEGATEVVTKDLVVGDGPAIVEGSTALTQLIVYRGDTLEVLDNTWLGGGPVQLDVVEAQLIDGIYQGLLGLRAGGRRVITIPFDLAFGEGGNESLGLPAATDLILVIDAIGVF
jgi:FKBP-type peptidyl-prolyl cis-trans isomerase